jgi:phosphotransferase system enzyme I (PtsI)
MIDEAATVCETEFSVFCLGDKLLLVNKKRIIPHSLHGGKPRCANFRHLSWVFGSKAVWCHMVHAKRRLSAETRLRGTPLAPGVAVGRACFYELCHVELDSPSPSGAKRETQRLTNSLRWLARQRSVLARKSEAKLGPEYAEIFQAHRMMLSDEAFQSQLLWLIEEQGFSAEQAVKTELNRYLQQFQTADSEYLQQRAADIREIQQALLDDLNRRVACRRCRDGANCSVGHCQLGNDHILIGEEIGASLPIETDEHTIGFIVERGGANSHAVILARALGYPVIGNIQQLPGCIPPDAQILVNGNTGEVVLDPTEETLSGYQSAFTAGGQSLQLSDPVPGLKVMANIEQSADVHDAIAAGAEGVGLYRTEMELLVAGRLLSESEQAACYREVIRTMAGKPVCIRLLDLGADKSAEWLASTRQDDPMARQRGARWLLAHPELLREQARALARASKHGPIHVLYPMIVDVGQFLDLRALFDRAVADLQPGGLQHGVLFEVPSACLSARQIMQVADFGCIGTNDLVQYLFAEDRGGGGAAVPSCFETDALLWELIQQISRVARQVGKPMAICGELAGNPDLTCRIMQAGISAISTSPSRIAKVRRAAQS